jgi:hypothetical protein
MPMFPTAGNAHDRFLADPREEQNPEGSRRRMGNKRAASLTGSRSRLQVDEAGLHANLMALFWTNFDGYFEPQAMGRRLLAVSPPTPTLDCSRYE